MTSHRSNFWFAVLLLSLTVWPALFAHAELPIAVIAGHEQYDIPRFTKRVLAPSGYVWEDCGTFLDPKDFGRYSIVVWFSGCKAPLSDAQTAALVTYLEAGGKLLHTGGGIYLTGLSRKFKPHPWTGTKHLNYHRDSERRSYPFLLTTHPYLSGIDVGKTYSWQTAYFSLTIETNATRNIIGEGSESILCSTPVGKGEIIWCWEGPFRTRNWEKPADSAVFDQLLLNILKGAAPLKVTDQLRQEVVELSHDPATLVCWKRDWDYASQDDYVFNPAYPRPNEALHCIEFSSAMDERDTQFLLCQSLVPQRVRVEVTPLQRSGSDETVTGRLRLFISDRPPLVPSLVNKGMEELSTKLGRFMLTPVDDSITIEDWHPRVLWLELSTHGLTPGTYIASLKLTGQATTREIPVQVKVYPVRMPRNRIARLLYWGGCVPNREPFLSEMERQSCPQISLTYPVLASIRLRATGQSLAEAIRKNPTVFAAAEFPALDFRGAYETNLSLALDHGLSSIRVQDVRTGTTVAQAGSGTDLDHDNPAEWPEVARRLYTGYYRELYRYLQEKGFDEVAQIWSDEPGWNYIQNNYIPRARLHMAGEMGSGTHWTASGFMSPDQVNTFAPYTTDWSMYSIMLPNFLSFLREGSVCLLPRASVGMTRGGCGFDLRNPFNQSRTLAWEMVHYGEPVNFLRTGPFWKEWLYYVDYDRSKSNRPDGVEGERLLAYGSSDPQNPDIPMLSSSDWEASREGVDDVNLVRILEWYLNNLKGGGWFNTRQQRLTQAIRNDMATWFQTEEAKIDATTGFDGGRLTGEQAIMAAGSEASDLVGFKIQRKKFDHGDNHYEYDMLVPPPTATLEALKRRVLDHLESLLPYAGKVRGSLNWHDWELAVDGRSRACLVLPEGASASVRKAAEQLLEHCHALSGCTPELLDASAWRKRSNRVNLVIGQASDAPVRDLLTAKGWTADAGYPGTGNYLIKRDQTDNLLLIVGVDEAGLLLGLRNFVVFLDGRGAWLQSKKN